MKRGAGGGAQAVVMDVVREAAGLTGAACERDVPLMRYGLGVPNASWEGVLRGKGCGLSRL